MEAALVDGLDLYLGRLQEKGLLSAAGERRLARRARAGSISARDELIEHNLRLVVGVAKRYRGQGVPFEDLIQEGNAGVIRAARGFDPSKGYRFSTYARYWIDQALQMAVATQGAAIRLPLRIYSGRRELSRHSACFESDNGREPTRCELARTGGLEPAALEELLDAPSVDVSLDAQVAGYDWTYWHAFAAETAEGAPESADEAYVGAQRALDAAYEALLKVEVDGLVDGLPPLQRRVIRGRYGLEGHAAASLSELGRRMGYSREKIRLTEAEALIALRDMAGVPHLSRH